MPVVMSVETHNHHDTRCPRCGYDLHGLIETWKHECPISGVCTECGLEFEWGELLNPRRSVPKWCVEYARGWRIFPSSYLTLYMLLLYPSRFWRELKVTHQPRVLLIPCVLLALAPLFYLLVVLMVGVNMYLQVRSFNLRYGSTATSPLVSGFHAVINPFSADRLNYPIPGGNWIWTAPSPREHLKYLRIVELLSDTRSALYDYRFFYFGRWRVSTIQLIHGLIPALLCPWVFILLPRSVWPQRERVRHVLRIWLYSLAFLTSPLVLYILFQLNHFLRSAYGGSPQLVSFYFLIVVCLIIFWSLASKHYLKLRYAWSTSCAAVILSYGVGLFLFLLVELFLI